ncbi:MAG: hypothetical protein SH817_17890 [Leptospira sp.]|nr:hypothetical protein [Leptospira sp.]
MDSITEFFDSFQSSFHEFFGHESELGWEIYKLNSSESANEQWMTFTIRNPLAGRALVFRFNETEDQFYAFLKVQVIPGEENWNLDVLFKKKGYSTLDSEDLKKEFGEWRFHTFARYYFGIILNFCPRILEPDYFID